MKKLEHIQKELNIKTFINKYSSKIDDCKTFEKNNSATALNILYIKEIEISPAFNSNCEKQIILLMFPNEEKEGWLYIITLSHYCYFKLSTLLHGMTKHDGGFYCLNCLHSFITEDKLKSHEKVCKNKVFCGIVILSEKGKGYLC